MVFAYGLRCACVFDRAVDVCPVHKTGVSVYTVGQCCVVECHQPSTGMCSGCEDKVVNKLVADRPRTLVAAAMAVIGMRSVLPGPAVNNPQHAYSQYIAVIIEYIVKKRPEFVVDGDNVCLASEWVSDRLDEERIAYADIAAKLKCSPARVAQFRMAVRQGMDKFVEVDGRTVARVVRYEYNSAAQVKARLVKAGYAGISRDHLYADHPDMSEFLSQLPVVCVNRRVYLREPCEDLSAHFVTLYP